MVDGQQRTRTILGFLKNDFKTSNGLFYDQDVHTDFLNYQIPITIIEQLKNDESIEDFYSLVNRAGIHLNRPELKKAEYFETRFYKLITELLETPVFQALDIFTDATTKRMNDIDFVSELITLLKEGVSDKKLKVDKLFESDISEGEYLSLKNRFLEISKILNGFNESYPIKKTRYRQRNDLYTIGIMNIHLDLSLEFWSNFYASLIQFNDKITPSNEKCEPFQDYAFHCVSQSNSKMARDKREELLLKIFFNASGKISKEQKEVAKYYNLPVDKLILNMDDLITINSDSIPETELV